MDIDQSTKEKIEKLPLILRNAAQNLLNCVERIVNGDCNEEEVTTTMGTLNQNAQGRYGKEDLMNYDKAARALGFSVTNRWGLLNLLNRYNIHQVILNNIKCGFKRSEIMALVDKLNEDVRKRELRERRKLERKYQKEKLKRKGR